MSRLLGIDYGTKRIGLALSDPTGILASPIPFLENNSPAKVQAALLDLIQKHGVTAIVIGLPRNMDGTYGPSAKLVRDFIQQIEPHLSLPIHPLDERLTTMQASRDLAGMGLNQKDLRKIIDSSSAALILQQFLDRAQLNP